MKKIQLAFRSLLHYKQYSIINILGLALSLACVIIIFRYVHGEMTVDRFNRNLDRIFVTTIETDFWVGHVAFSQVSNLNNEITFADLTQHPGVEKDAHIIFLPDDEIDVNERKFNATTIAADSNFLKILDFPIISGVADLSNPSTALISREFAQRLFGNENPIGKTFRHSLGNILTITGVIGETSTKSSLSFDVVVSRYLTRFWFARGETFVLLYSGVDYQTINRQYEEFFETITFGDGVRMRHQLFPFSSVYFANHISNSTFEQGNRQNINILMVVGFLILLIGIFNYINIYTVVMLRRSKELAIKKIFGAELHSAFLQLLMDNMVQIVLALLLAFVFTGISSPLVTNVLMLAQIPNIRFDVGLSVIILLVLSFITTLYPFYRYCYSTPTDSLRNIDKMRGGGSLRRVFLTFQYIITIAMIIVSLFFVKQLRFMLNFDLGFRTENVITIPPFMRLHTMGGGMSREEWYARQANEERILDEVTHRMNASPLFTHWTGGGSPNMRMSESNFSYLDGGFREISFWSASADWFDMFDIQLIDGRLWDNEIDSWEQYKVIVTESTLRFFGITDWRTALLQPERRIRFSQETDTETNPPYRIVGVVRDFTPGHLSRPAQPTLFLFSEGGFGTFSPLTAVIVPNRTQDAIAFLRTLHEETIGGEFTFTFLEDEMRAMYAEDRKVATIYSIFTLIAILISALGLFGMSFFDIQQRRREIAIRKVNGASVSDIINLLLKKYLISLGIAFVIAAPIAAYAINRYLEDFAHRAPVAWWLFAVALLITAGISLLTLIYQTYKAANQNPAEVVKSE